MRSAPTPRRARLEFALFAALPLVLTLALAVMFRSLHTMSDFHKEFWPAAHRILAGRSPYVLTHAQIADGRAFPYPAALGVLLTPLALLPRDLAETVFMCLCWLALFATLRTLGVRDRRIYGIVLLWAPVINAWQSGNMTLILALGAALTWRHRDRPAVAGMFAALTVCLKPFVWPLGLWLLVTRRYAAAAWMLVTGVVVNAIAFAVIGFDQIARYLDDAQRVAGVFYRHSYTLTSLSLDLGLPHSVAVGTVVVAAVAGAVACLLLGRRGSDSGALALAVAVALLATPVLWLHYFALAVVPFAVARPRLQPVWALPIILIVCGSRTLDAWQTVLALSVFAVLLATAARGDAARVRRSAATGGRRAGPAALTADGIA